METSHDHLASDLSTLRPAFRRDLQIHSGDGLHFVVEDPVSGNYYRLGPIEFRFSQLLDGRRSIAEAYAELCQREVDLALTENDAAELCRWLIAVELAQTESSRSAERIKDASDRSQRGRIKQRLNPIAIRIPLLQPDRWVGRIEPLVGWLFGWPATCLGILLILFGLSSVVTNWTDLAASRSVLFAPGNLIWLTLATVVLKVIHEFSHAIVCKRYGGDVGEMGVLLILFAPLAYVDVTSVWRFASRWKRVHVAAAGIYVELLIAAVAALLWPTLDSAELQRFCVNVMLSCGVSSIVFNVNPLMKFDGYFMLTDLAGTPNLYADSQRALARSAKQVLLGTGGTMLGGSLGYRRYALVYGIAAFVWRWIVCVGLIIVAVSFYRGVGLVLSAITVSVWFAGPMGRIFTLVRSLDSVLRRRLLRRASALLAGAGVLLFALPWPQFGSYPAIVEYSPHTSIRAPAAGFIEQLHVTAGSHVQIGQLLITLRNDKLRCDALDLELQIEQSRVRRRQHTQKGRHAEAQAELAAENALIEQFNELTRQLDQLSIRAPRSGVIVRRGLRDLQGQYVDQGDELCAVGTESRKELRIAIEQEAIDRFRARSGAPIRYAIEGLDPQVARIERVVPRASRQVPHPALSASNGGPLAVKPVSTANHAGGDKSELLTPHFRAIVPLTSDQSLRLSSGQRVSVYRHAFDRSIGQHLWDLARGISLGL
ncbi:HlyD family efflux transporter periplasmic adaptor subunit [Roseiconus nitratireducens]|uniref:HlyD family efflux transporter periplasmic adaptor subunit n=1 Tax=Roseiconus nitratireducens TaxID=2605748 RepID=A0A5M6D070_9BACT|nr:HlyD family efflux transporter periplasmic adaptor subunit [Roseiconus nitratireducens]KAA5538545.1 HlyD family efflux transporter periplasmic adaptor subunit [Roseiconus nitratireducens]